MKNRYLGYSVAATAILLVFVSVVAAQNAAQPAAVKPTPRMSNGRPDFTGLWMTNVAGLANYNDDVIGPDANLTRLPDGSTIFLYGGPAAQIPNRDQVRNDVPENSPPYKPEYMSKVKELVATIYGSGNTSSPFDPMNECKPNGVPRSGISGTHIVMNPSAVAILYENNPGPVHRIIYTDGRKHPDRLDTSFMGHSIGHWEGDTLVIDTIGLNDETWLGGAKYQNQHSDQLHVVERWSRQGDVMTRSVTVEDPVMFTRPWTYGPEETKLGTRDDYIQPQMCKTNDKAHLTLQTEDNVYKCTWCIHDVEAVYGQGAQRGNADVAPRRGGGGGGE